MCFSPQVERDILIPLTLKKSRPSAHIRNNIYYQQYCSYDLRFDIVNYLPRISVYLHIRFCLISFFLYNCIDSTSFVIPGLLRNFYISLLGTAVAQWLRYCATNQKVAASIQDGVMELFIDIYPSDRTMVLGSNQPLTEMSTGSICWGKCGRCVRLTTLPPSCAVVKKSGNLKFL
jgi:hypothetical protein